jgi:hypothetical protein
VSRKMSSRVAEAPPEWRDHELDGLVKGCVVVFGEDVTDDTIIHVTQRYCREIEVVDALVPEALVPCLWRPSKQSFAGC